MSLDSMTHLSHVQNVLLSDVALEPCVARPHTLLVQAFRPRWAFPRSTALHLAWHLVRMHKSGIVQPCCRTAPLCTLCFRAKSTLDPKFCVCGCSRRPDPFPVHPLPAQAQVDARLRELRLFKSQQADVTVAGRAQRQSTRSVGRARSHPCRHRLQKPRPIQATLAAQSLRHSVLQVVCAQVSYSGVRFVPGDLQGRHEDSQKRTRQKALCGRGPSAELIDDPLGRRLHATRQLIPQGTTRRARRRPEVGVSAPLMCGTHPLLSKPETGTVSLRLPSARFGLKAPWSFWDGWASKTTVRSGLAKREPALLSPLMHGRPGRRDAHDNDCVPCTSACLPEAFCVWTCEHGHSSHTHLKTWRWRPHFASKCATVKP